MEMLAEGEKAEAENILGVTRARPADGVGLEFDSRRPVQFSSPPEHTVTAEYR